ncbi:uncharacterized protein KGF55_001673 [Candida pseudojiufengensis]|uniref:uncharacterized protein n=1 Tax=Candida pseudojiufengensis TaxID=497109 RepID=UPI002223F16B|nr:uncharacterized protein KGF55_001673 [Candida pseudojiufengensis]KAI5964604.1 hypothetical protein KGF55_001673 [Candida pseudojiufengensis]
MDWYTNSNHKKRNSLNNNNFAGLNLNSTTTIQNNNNNNFNGRSSGQNSPATSYSNLNNNIDNINNSYHNYSMKHQHHNHHQQSQQIPYSQYNNQNLQPPYHINTTGRSPSQISTSPSNMTTPIGFTSSNINSLSNTPMINAYTSSNSNSSSIPINNPMSAIPNYMTSSSNNTPIGSSTTPVERNSYYFSQFPLFTCDWTTINNNSLNCIALGSYKEGFTNKLEIVHGTNYDNENQYSRYQQQQHHPHLNPQIPNSSSSSLLPDGSSLPNNTNNYYDDYDNSESDGILFQKVAETNLNYPITHLKWDPSMLKYNNYDSQRLAASSEVLRLYNVKESNDSNFNLIQTHILANNTATNTSKSSTSNLHDNDINTLPPVTSFDWNTTDPNILITSSVDTTCTVWDLNRSHSYDEFTDTAVVKTQLIAHDSEVFDVKFIHKSTNVFVSVGNDGSMRVFDLRSLEHSTIIYEPQPEPPSTSTTKKNIQSQRIHSSNFNSKALLKLSASNIDQHHLATIGVNSNQIIIIDMRMPGIPMATIDGSINSNPNFSSSASINSISWHPTSNYLLSGGDDCQALVWDINNLHNNHNSNYTNSSSSSSLSNGGNNGNNGNNNGNDSTSSSINGGSGLIIDTPVLAYEEDLEVNNVCWKQNSGDYMGVVSGKGFQAVKI